jgi:hypothetical protein
MNTDLETSIAKARKIKAIIDHPATPQNERTAAIVRLSSLLERNNITLQQLESSEKNRVEFSSSSEDDFTLIKQVIAAYLNTRKMQVNRMNQVSVEITHSQHIEITEMLRYYRNEFVKTVNSLQSEIDYIKKELKKANAAKKSAMSGFIQKMNIFPEADPAAEPPKPLTKEQAEAMLAAMHATQGKPYSKPADYLSSDSPSLIS